MSLYAKLAQLRPGMGIAKLQEIVGTNWTLPSSGKVLINAETMIGFDTAERINSIRFQGGFPVRVPVFGYHAGMHRKEAEALRPLEFLYANSFGTLDFYRAKTDTPYEVVLHLSKNRSAKPSAEEIRKVGTISTIEIAISGSVYGQVSLGVPFTSIEVSATRGNSTQEMLADWVQASASLDADDNVEPYARWLSTVATPDDWHHAISFWNYDYGFLPPFWIIRQQNCEYATALETFYLFEGPSVVEEKSADDDDLTEEDRLVFEIRDRAIAGAYKRQTIAFDGEEAVRRYFGDHEAASARSLQLVPPALRLKIGTRQLTPDAMQWAAGFPVSMRRG